MKEHYDRRAREYDATTYELVRQDGERPVSALSRAGPSASG
jgi:hypothetical protein